MHTDHSCTGLKRVAEELGDRHYCPERRGSMTSVHSIFARRAWDSGDGHPSYFRCKERAYPRAPDARVGDPLG